MHDDRVTKRFQSIATDVVLGEGATVHEFVNLYGCTIGAFSRVGAFVEIQRDATIGAHCKISTHSFICSGVHIGDRVFVGHGVTFVNDRHPRACNADGTPKGSSDWKLEPRTSKTTRRSARVRRSCVAYASGAARWSVPAPW